MISDFWLENSFAHIIVSSCHKNEASLAVVKFILSPKISQQTTEFCEE